MGYQTGQVSPYPIVYHQDNTGSGTDINTPLTFQPIQYGAPPGGQWLIPQCSVLVHVERGSAGISDQQMQPDDISFTVWTQAASNALFGHHSSAITVSVYLTWWFYEADAATKQGYEASAEDCLRELNIQFK